LGATNGRRINVDASPDISLRFSCRQPSKSFSASLEGQLGRSAESKNAATVHAVAVPAALVPDYTLNEH
jgi:hypothetical protein